IETVIHQNINGKVSGRKIIQLFQGSNLYTKIIGENKSEYYTNYFKYETKLTHLPSYKSIKYQGIYNGIDLVIDITEKGLKSNWIVSPGADFTQIKIKYEGAINSIDLNANILKIKTDLGDLTENAPFTYDQNNITVPSQYSFDKSVLSFSLAEFDHSKTLVIDPLQLISSTFIGGANEDFFQRVTANPVNNYIHMLGRSNSINYPTTNAYDTIANGDYDVTITVYDPTQTQIKYCTYIGGTKAETPYEWDFEKSTGNFVVSGTTWSADFPKVNAFQTSLIGMFDGFIFKMNYECDSIIFSSLLGGSGLEYAYAVAIVQETKNIYVGGSTSSTNFPLLNAMQTTLQGGLDGFISKFSPNGSLLNSTFIGGNSGDEIRSIAIIPSVINDGIAAFCGLTVSNNLPVTSNAIDLTYNTNGTAYNDAMIGIYDGNSSGLQYLTYFGGSTGNDWPSKIAVEPITNHLVVVGSTDCSDFPINNAITSTYQGGITDGYILKINTNSNTPVFSTYFGGSGTWGGDEIYDLFLEPNTNNIIFCGSTWNGQSFPTVNPFKSGMYVDSCDAFFCKLSPNGQTIHLSTLFGGSNTDEANGIFYQDSTYYVVGRTFSNNLPTIYPYDSILTGGMDGFLSIFTEKSTSLGINPALLKSRNQVYC
ncbi:MAG: hypothetical protein JHD28_09990, partial [Bacteroidia bacterium]|nr:hypothetical protein [Bacteroidia bacterium]